MPQQRTQEDFIREANATHNFKYDYRLTRYINARTKVQIICPIHGSFWQRAEAHVRGCGCEECWREKQHSRHAETLKRNELEKEKKKILLEEGRLLREQEFLTNSKNLFGEKFDYSKVYYINNRSPITLICKEHGEFKTTGNRHLTFKYGGCKKCEKKYKDAYNLLSPSEYFLRAKNIYGNKFSYDELSYINTTNRITLTCNDCGHVFKRSANSHISRYLECPVCRLSHSSKGEDKIKEILTRSGVVFITQKRFKECRDVYPLPFDFYIPTLNTVIEYQGTQHYEAVNFGSVGREREAVERDYKTTLLHDDIKRKFCKEKNIKEIEISFKDFENIETILKREGVISNK